MPSMLIVEKKSLLVGTDTHMYLADGLENPTGSPRGPPLSAVNR